MKFGFHQWGRVASLLLGRKSAKQCKARWTEWLDPSIRKIEWSPEEEDRLMELAEQLPSQWKTISGVLGGRTASQCQEKYNQVLDRKLGSELSTTAHFETVFDPNVQKARPDAIDLDADEKGLLQEARARFAARQGKKEERRRRERQLEETKRIVEMQRVRELKIAGQQDASLLLRKTSRRLASKQQRTAEARAVNDKVLSMIQAPQGLHSTELEDAHTQARRQSFQPLSLAMLRQRSRSTPSMQAKRQRDTVAGSSSSSRQQQEIGNKPISGSRRAVDDDEPYFPPGIDKQTHLPEPSERGGKNEAKRTKRQRKGGKSGVFSLASLPEPTHRRYPMPTGRDLAQLHGCVSTSSTVRSFEEQARLLVSQEAAQTEPLCFDPRVTQCALPNQEYYLQQEIARQHRRITALSAELEELERPTIAAGERAIALHHTLQHLPCN